MIRAALAGAHIFAWIFTFEYFTSRGANIDDAFVRTILLYALTQLVVCLVTPYTARYLRFGARRAFLLAVPLAAISLTLLAEALGGRWTDVSASYAIVAFAIAIGLYRAFYWVPYVVESAEHARKESPFTGPLLVATAPLIGGLLVALVGPQWLLYVGSGIIALSIIPLFYVLDIREKFTWGYRETFTRLLTSDDRRISVVSFLDGISGAALLFFWPFAVFLIVGGSYGMLGVVLSITLALMVVTRGIIRRQWRRNIKGSPMLSVVFAVTPWLFRVLIATPIGVVLADLYFYATTPRRMGVDPFTHEQTADSGSYIDEFTALKEMGLALGRLTICLLAASVVTLTSMPIALGFVILIAALASAVTVAWQR